MKQEATSDQTQDQDGSTPAPPVTGPGAKLWDVKWKNRRGTHEDTVEARSSRDVLRVIKETLHRSERGGFKVLQVERHNRGGDE